MVKRAQVDARLHFDTGFLFARLRFVCEPVIYFGQKHLDKDRVEYVQKSWELLEAFLESSDYVCGSELTIADFACISTVCSIDNIAPIDAAKYPKLLAWIKRMESIPHYDSLCGAHGKQLQEVVRSKLN